MGVFAVAVVIAYWFNYTYLQFWTDGFVNEVDAEDILLSGRFRVDFNLPVSDKVETTPPNSQIEFIPIQLGSNALHYGSVAAHK